jgi:hypothetical protein
MTAVLILLAIFSVPLGGILARTVLKWRRMELESGRAGNPQLEARLTVLERENRELRSRMETLETIAIDAPRTTPKQLTSG